MKKSTINLITTILGILIICTILPVIFIIENNLGIILPFLLLGGSFLIYFKNNDLKAVVKNYLNKFS